ncbi:hypothetical protein BsWGS_13843 [Bradybaena similaris]
MNNPAYSADAAEDGAVVLSIPVPSLPKAVSLPELTALSNGSASKSSINSKYGAVDSEKGNAVTAENKKDKSLTELLKTFRLHIFVCTIFLITTLSVSLSWHFRIMAQEQLYASQAIFFNPRTREITLADPTSRASVHGHLGLDIPSWMLPLHCPIVSSGDPNYKECLWKNEAELKIVHLKDQDVQCYNISWASLGPRYAPHDCFYIHTDKWYGPTNQSESSFPITGEFYFQPKKNYTLSNNGMFNSVVDFYWLSSSGAAIYINANSPIQVAWNVSGDNQLCMRSNFSGPLYHKTNAYDYPDMNYILCNGVDPLRTHSYMQTFLAPAGLTYPPTHMLRGTHWSMENYASTNNITQEQVVDLLRNITEHGFPDNHITLDGDWQKDQGDLSFNVQQFPNVTEMLEMLRDKGCELTISVSPYFQYTSQNFHKGIASSVFVRDAGGEVTGLTKFQGGLAAILDVFTEDAVQWYIQKLQTVIATYGIHSYRLTYGEEAWLPYKPHFSDIDATPNQYRRVVTESFASMPRSSLVVEHTSDSRHVASFIPVVSEFGLVHGSACITSIIETALTLGLMGYPFVMADGIRPRQQDQPLMDDRPPRELYIRWIQLAILFPAYQFSIVPWDYDPDLVIIAKNLTSLRQELILGQMENEDLKKEIAKGYPILRPVWWLDPDNMTVHEMQIKDEFLIGNNFLVAPVMCEGITERDIYVPPGVWEDVHLGSLILGPNILRGYAVTQEIVPMFKRREVVGDKSPVDLHFQQPKAV